MKRIINFKLIRVNYFNVSIISISICFLCSISKDVSAQTLNANGSQHTINANGANRNEGTPQDFIIPTTTTYNSISFTLRGGDGGYAKYADECLSNGGEGATTTATFSIGNNFNELKPGGTIRFIVGKYGTNAIISFNGRGAGSGGGGTGVLYRPSANDSWVTLAVAGGGGGAHQGNLTGICVDSQLGEGGRASESGSNGEGSGAGNGGTNGDSGTDGGGQKGTGINSCFPDGCEGSVYSTLKGGYGIGGGGAGQATSSTGGGGGGGGYSGGGGGANYDNGGGGGSFVNNNYAISSSKTDGRKGEGNSINGNVKYTFQCLNSETFFPNANCKNQIVSVNGPTTITAASFDNGSNIECDLDLSFTFSDGSTSKSFNCQSSLGLRTYTIIVTASNGNTASCTAGVNLVDGCDPFVTCVGNTDVLVGSTITPEDLIATNDDPDMLTFKFGDNATSRTYDCTQLGNTITETVIATDPAGNTTTCNVDITVTSNSVVAIWTGDVSSAWNEPCNWNNALVPDINTDVTIPDVAIDPIISGTTSAVAKTVTIESSGLFTINNNGSLTLNSFLVLNGNMNIQSGGVVSATRTTINTGGVLTNNGNLTTTSSNIVINSGGLVQGNGFYEIATHWSNSGTFNAGTSKVKLTNIFESIIGGSSATTFYDLEIDRIGGGVIGAALQNSCTIEHELIMTQGRFSLNGYNITLNGDIVNESSSNYIYGNGLITKTLNLNAPYAAFPGNLGVVITSDANLGMTTIQRGHIPQNVNGNPGIERYYNISPTNNMNLDATVSFLYLDHELNGISESNLAPFRNNGGSWAELPTTNVNSIWNFVETNHINAFSSWTLGNNCGTQNIYYLDADSDGYGTPNDFLYFCSAPSGYVTNNSDCNDLDPNVNPIPNCSGFTRTWTGHVNASWEEACNWTPNCVPTANDDVIIPDVATPPIIYHTSIAEAKNINIASGGLLTINLGGSLNQSGSLIINGLLDIHVLGTVSANEITVNSGGILTNNGSISCTSQPFTNNRGGTLQGNGVYNVAGNWGNAGNFVVGNSKVRFYGNTESIISGPNSGFSTFYDLEIDKSVSGTGASIIRNLMIEHDLIMTLGTVNTDGFIISLNGNIINESSNSYLFGYGSIFKTIDLNAPSSVNPGNLGVTITSAANLGTTSILRSHNVETIDGVETISRTYSINPTNNSGLNATVRFHYLDHELNGNTEDVLIPFRDNVEFWENYLVSNRNVDANWVETTNVDAFSTWTLAREAGCVPVTFYLDEDGDGYGNPEGSAIFCEGQAPSFYVTNNLDCNDSDPNVNPTPDCSTLIRTWTGEVSTDWNDPCNWSPNCVPGATNIVFIPNRTNDPVISGTSSVIVYSITVDPGSFLTVQQGGNLEIRSGQGTNN